MLALFLETIFLSFGMSYNFFLVRAIKNVWGKGNWVKQVFSVRLYVCIWLGFRHSTLCFSYKCQRLRLPPWCPCFLYASCLWVSLETSHIASEKMHHYFSCDLLLLYIGPPLVCEILWRKRPVPVIGSQQCGEPRSLDCDLYNHFSVCFLLFLRWVGAVWYFLLLVI